SVTGVQTCALPIWTWSLGCMPRLRAGGGERTANSRNQGHRVAGAGCASEGRARIVLRLKSPTFRSLLHLRAAFGNQTRRCAFKVVLQALKKFVPAEPGRDRV